MTFSRGAFVYDANVLLSLLLRHHFVNVLSASLPSFPRSLTPQILICFGGWGPHTALSLSEVQFHDGFR